MVHSSRLVEEKKEPKQRYGPQNSYISQNEGLQHGINTEEDLLEEFEETPNVAVMGDFNTHMAQYSQRQPKQVVSVDGHLVTIDNNQYKSQ